MIDRNSRTPLYVQLANILRQQIISGEIKPGNKLPSEAEMIKQYNLGRLTIRDSLAILENEGLIEKQHGRGTFCKTNCALKKYKIDVLLNLTDVYFIPIYLKSVCKVLEDEGANVVLRDTKNSSENICLQLNEIIREGTDGILIQPSFDAHCPPDELALVFKKLVQSKIPYIMIDSAFVNVPQSYVIMDEYKAGYMAAQYFKNLSHKHLCMIALKNYADSEKRMQGFSDALDEMPYRINYSDDLYTSVTTMLNVRDDITGIFCHNDMIAKKCYEVLNRLNIGVYDEMSLISVDDTVIASTLTPSLTSVVHPKELLGETSAKAIISIIKGDIPWPYKKTFEPRLNIRNSCRKLR